MAVFADFVGQSYTADSLLADAQSATNLYLEAIESGKGQNTAYLRETPGLILAQTLPTSPIRGIWIGEGRMFVVAGAVLYECFEDNTYDTFGNVENDFLPVQIFPNGTQLLIISAGQAWVTGGGAPVPALYPNRFGEISTDATGLIVTWISGTKFDSSMVGFPIFIDTVSYTVASFNSSTEIVISASAGVTAGSPYSMALAVTGTVTTDHTHTITWDSGMKFDASMVGNTVVINSLVAYKVTGFTDDTHLVVDALVPTVLSPVSFSATVPVFASQGAFLDGRYIVAAPNSKQMNCSEVNDGTTWPLLWNASKQSYPDNIASLLTDHDELYVYGTTEETEVWQTNAAATAFALQRNKGYSMHHACIASYSPCRLGEGVAWLGGGARGWTIAYRATGFVPGRVSTHAIETIWKSYPTTSDAVSFVYVEDGHEFWVITFPSGNATWVYDATAGAWHRRGWWNGTALDRQRQMSHGFVFGNHYVGDWQNGNLYIQTQAADTDNGQPILRQRAAPHLNNEHDWSYYDSLELLLDAATPLAGFVVTHDSRADIQYSGGSHFNSAMAGLPIVIGGEEFTVLSVADTTNATLASNFTGTAGDPLPYTASYPARPTLTLDWSDDGGYNWHAGKTKTPNGVLKRALRTIWRRLGRSRDRIYRVSWFASGKVSIVNAYLDLGTEE